LLELSRYLRPEAIGERLAPFDFAKISLFIKKAIAFHASQTATFLFLLLAQCAHGIDVRGAQRGGEGGDYRDEYQDDRHNSED
jgi:hypothetical protein